MTEEEIAYIEVDGERYCGSPNDVRSRMGFLMEQDLLRGSPKIETVTPENLGQARPISDLGSQFRSLPYWR